MKHKVLSSETKFIGRVFTAKVEEVVMPNGSTVMREIAEHKGGASIVAVDGDEIIMVKQYRHAAGDFMLEIPAGILEPGEDPGVCAGRELEEETGYIAQEIVPLTKMYMSVGYVNEVHHIYLGTNLKKGTQHLDDEEDVEVLRLKIDDVIEKFFSGEIGDSKTIAGILAYKEYLKREK